MKKIILLLTATVVTVSLFAQAPQKMSYQAVIRNASNVLVANTAVGMRISILQGSAAGAAVYVETQTPTTNTNGLATIEIGSGTVVSGTFAAINWSTGLYWVKTETDPAGGTAYNIIGINQLLSVPYALFAASDGNHIIAPGNIGIGNDVLRNNTTGSGNIAIGGGVLGNNTTGNINTALGVGALGWNNTGSRNTAIGNLTLANNYSGNNNTATGSNALYFYAFAADNNTANGCDALRTGAGSNNSAFGYQSLAGNDDGYSYGENNTATGAYSMRRHPTGNNNTANGYNSLYNNFFGYSNVGIGVSALYNNTNASNLVAVGDSSLYSNTTGTFNTAVGSKSLYSNTTGLGNTANGFKSLYSNTTGFGNTANGDLALSSTTTGQFNTANGAGALLANTSGGSNTANGAHALNFNNSGSSNTATGDEALYSNVTGNGNTATGSSALHSNITGTLNTALGYAANVSTGNLTNATAIGANAVVNTSNNIQLGNENITAVKTSGKLTTGVITYPNTHGLPGQVLTTPGSGELIWTNSTGGVSVSVGQILQNPIPEGLSIDNGILHLHPADAGNGGIVNTFAQNFSGQKTFFDKTFFLNETETSGKATFLNETRTTGKATFLNETETSGKATFLNETKTTGKATFLNETETSGKATFFQDIYVHGLTVGRGSPTGNDNTVLGSLALTLPAPVSGNTAIGSQSLRNCIGFNNIALGFGAGLLNQNGSSNIYIGNAGSEESNTIRIGSNGNHQKIFLAGISPISSAQPLYAGADGQLGILVSSARFKENIEDMDNSISDDLLKLHPVTFEYKDEVANGDKTIQYGLIAEEVAKVNSDLVIYDKEGKPYTIRYQMLTPMLVSALQKEHKLAQEQQEKNRLQQKQIDELKENKQLLQKQINEQNEKIQSLQKQMDELKQFLNNPKQK